MKKQIKHVKQVLGIGLFSVLLAATSSCKKSDNGTTIAAPAYSVGKPVTGDTIQGSIKGYLQQGKTYYMAGNVTIDATDTLVVQPGVKVEVLGNYYFKVSGAFLSLGTESEQIYFTYQGLTKEDNMNTDPLSDPAYQGHWLGFQCDTSFTHLIFKWSHIEYAGGLLGTAPVAGLTANAQSWVVFTNNPAGIFVMEDSWLYGSNDDAMRISGARVHIMRNTFEKCGLDGGECMNIKSGTTGNIAYNLIIGAATEGIKPSQSGSHNPETFIVAYNNTILNGGYRQNELGRGGSIDYEDQARGQAYNNLIVDCKFGLRIVGATTSYEGNALIAADLANITYGNTLTYCDSVNQAQQIYPEGLATVPQSTDIPAYTSFLPTGYKPGDTVSVANAMKAVGVDNPKFVGYTLPQPDFQSIAYATGWNFNLSTGSPAIGAGTTNFTLYSPVNGATTGAGAKVPQDPNYGYTTLNLPSVDLGAYPTNGNGNQH